jgi:hypothetical protein
MKSNILIFFSLLFFVSLFFGCVTQNACLRKFPPASSDSITILKHDTILRYLHDTIITPGQTITDTFLIPSTPSTLIVHNAVKRDHLSANISVSNGKVIVTCHEDELKRVNDSLVHVITIKTTDNRQKVVTVTTFVVHWYDMMARWISGILLLLIAGMLLGKFLKSKFPI